MKKLFAHLRTFFYLLPEVILVFFSKPETVDYPKQSTPYRKGFRGSVKIVSQNCVGCSLCTLDCPASALRLIKISKDSYTLEHIQDRCTYCGQCQKSCKFNAIYLDNTINQPSSDRNEFITILVKK